jgi:hypothetical protein
MPTAGRMPNQWVTRFHFSNAAQLGRAALGKMRRWNALFALRLDWSHLGRVSARSVHPSAADIRRLHRHVRFVPTDDMARRRGHQLLRLKNRPKAACVSCKYPSRPRVSLLRNPARYPHSKTKSSADLLKDLPCVAAVVAVEKVAIETIKKSYGRKRRKRHR